jgi:phage baseplate assembly protein W
MKGIGIYDGDFVQLKQDKELITENVKRVLTTMPGERVGNLTFGSRVREYLFNFSDILLEDMEQVIISAISTWEPRVDIIDVSVIVDEKNKEKMNIDLKLKLKENLDEFNLSIPIVF